MFGLDKGKIKMNVLDRFKKKHPPPIDYLYIDQTRLNSYIAQISSTNSLRRSPSLTLGMSDSGPSISAELSPEIREKTEHEKVCELITHLERNGHIARSRPSVVKESGDYIKIPDFILEECDAYRVLIPSSKNMDGKEGIVIWVSEWPLERNTDSLIPPGLLCLIQDSTYDDIKHTAGFSNSGYTWLQALLYQLEEEYIETQLSKEYPILHLGEYNYDIMSVQSYLYRDQHIFRPQPLEWLRQKGCILSESRRIEALYRIRNLGGDEIGTQNKVEDFTVTTFAYAIAIWGGRTFKFSGPKERAAD